MVDRIMGGDLLGGGLKEGVGDDEVLRYLQQQWARVLSILKESRLPQTEVFLREGYPVKLAGNTLTIRYAPHNAFMQASLERYSRNKTIAERVISSLVKREIKLHTEIGEIPKSQGLDFSGESQAEGGSQSHLPQLIGTGEGEQDSRPPAPSIPEDEERKRVIEHPAVQKALQLFAGQIVEVKSEQEGE